MTLKVLYLVSFSLGVEDSHSFLQIVNDDNKDIKLVSRALKVHNSLHIFDPKVEDLVLRLFCIYKELSIRGFRVLNCLHGLPIFQASTSVPRD